MCNKVYPGNVTYVEATPVQRALDRLPVACENKCGAKNLTRGNLQQHLATCAHKQNKCPCPGCHFSPASNDAFLHHLITTHAPTVLANSSRLFTPNPPPTTTTTTASPLLQIPQPQPPQPDLRIEKVTNARGRSSRLGTSGMRYCGGRLPSPSCKCCDGGCGPGNGCACLECMQLAIQLRKLPIGWLVNREGASCRRGVTGLFYCGKRHSSLERIGGCDGYCGPTDGPQCQPCAKLQYLAPLWYRTLY